MFTPNCKEGIILDHRQGRNIGHPLDLTPPPNPHIIIDMHQRTYPSLIPNHSIITYIGEMPDPHTLPNPHIPTNMPQNLLYSNHQKNSHISKDKKLLSRYMHSWSSSIQAYSHPPLSCCLTRHEGSRGQAYNSILQLHTMNILILPTHIPPKPSKTYFSPRTWREG